MFVIIIPLIIIIIIIIIIRSNSYILVKHDNNNKHNLSRHLSRHVCCVCTSDILHVSLPLHNSLIAVAVQISSVEEHLIT